MRFLILLAFPLFAAAAAAPKLSSFHIQPGSVTVSGISSGAFMAIQMHVAHSDLIKGAASVAGGPYGCAMGNPQRATGVCMGNPAEIQTAELVKEAGRLAAARAVAPLDGLRDARVYIYASTGDPVVKSEAGEKIAEFYRGLGVTAIRHDLVANAGHGFPTLDKGVPCAESRVPWVNSCGYDGAGEILAHLYGGLSAKTTAVAGHLLAFDQKEFSAPLSEIGYLYVPESCAQGASCRLHVALHGCEQNFNTVKDAFIREAGYNEWAESNGIVVLYPQARKFPKTNPAGCWDWFGYTGPAYATQAGPQIQALKKMIDRARGL